MCCSKNSFLSEMATRINVGRMYQPVVRILMLLTLVVTGATISTAAPVAAQVPVPALLVPSNPEIHIGKIIFMELISPDIESAKRFYSGLFGWTFQTTTSGNLDYAEAYINDYPIAGLIQKKILDNEHRQSAWLTFISVGDIDAAKTLAVQHGAKVLVAPKDVPDRGRQAVLLDPEGAVFAMLTSNSGDPSDVLSVPGEWIWSSLLSSDPDAGAAFYQALFNYEIFELPAKTGTENLMLASENYARASINSLPSGEQGRHSDWISYVRVVDADSMVAKVVELGGKILVKPRIDRHGEKVAIVADPAGALFGLLEWAGIEMKEVTK